jgi:hypothetical protein
LSDDRAAKHGLSYERVIREKKDICTTAIISTPIILPEIIPKIKTPRETIAAAFAKVEVILLSLYA